MSLFCKLSELETTPPMYLLIPGFHLLRSQSHDVESCNTISDNRYEQLGIASPSLHLPLITTQ